MSVARRAYVVGLNNAYHAGYYAGVAKASCQACPYTRTDMVACWEDGWRAGTRDLIKRKKRKRA